MVRSQHPPALELARKVKVNRGSASLRRPILAHEGLYVGHKAQDLVKLSGERLEPEWRIPVLVFEGDL